MKTSRKDFLLQSLLGAAGLSKIPDLLSNRKFTGTGNSASVISNDPEAGFKISVFSKHLQWLGYSAMADTAARIGFDGVDLTVRPGGHVLPENATKDLPSAVDAVRSSGLEVYMITTAITDPDQPHAEAVLKTASELGIQRYRTGWFRYDNKSSVPENLEVYKSKLKKLAAFNRRLGIRGDYQNHSGTSFGSPVWDLWSVLSEINAGSGLGCQYDIRHATVEGAQSWPLGLEAISPYIGTLDIKDFTWAREDGRWDIRNVPLGRGMVDFQRYFSLLKQHEVSAPISLHYEYPLGGANHGATSLSIEQEQVLGALERDLKILKGWLSKQEILNE